MIDKNTEKMLGAVETALCEAVKNRDRDGLDKVLRDDFIATGHAGNVVDKAKYMEIHLSSRTRVYGFRYIRNDLSNLRRCGDFDGRNQYRQRQNARKKRLRRNATPPFTFKTTTRLEMHRVAGNTDSNAGKILNKLTNKGRKL